MQVNPLTLDACLSPHFQMEFAMPSPQIQPPITGNLSFVRIRDSQLIVTKFSDKIPRISSPSRKVTAPAEVKKSIE